MSTKSKIATLAAVAIVIAAPAFAGQRVKPTLHSAFAGAFASSADPGEAHVNPVQRRANNNLNPDIQLGASIKPRNTTIEFCRFCAGGEASCSQGIIE